jgi:hypothetical protein
MSRSGYTEDYEYWALIRYRGAVASALRGFRGQCFLQELRAALDTLPDQRLIAGDLQDEYDASLVCAIGAVGKRRGIDMSAIDPHYPSQVAEAFGIAESMAREIAYENDECLFPRSETPEERFSRMRDWVGKQLDEKVGS